MKKEQMETLLYYLQSLHNIETAKLNELRKHKDENSCDISVCKRVQGEIIRQINTIENKIELIQKAIRINK